MNVLFFSFDYVLLNHIEYEFLKHFYTDFFYSYFCFSLFLLIYRLQILIVSNLLFECVECFVPKSYCCLHCSYKVASQRHLQVTKTKTAEKEKLFNQNSSNKQQKLHAIFQLYALLACYIYKSNIELYVTSI